MDKRFRIGLNYFFDNKTNSGIVNYIFNIIAALKTLEDDKKPDIVVFYSENAPVDFLKSINYPFIKFILFSPNPSNFYIRRLNAKVDRLLNTDMYKQFRYFNKIDCLYPYFEFGNKETFKHAKNKIHWLVDFNNKAFPDHYEKGTLEILEDFQSSVTSRSEEKIVLSSNTLLNELRQYYPNYKCKVEILKFASTLSIPAKSQIDNVISRFDIAVPYFMSPNQFWEHKNQAVVLKAIQLIREKIPELKFKVLFTGSLEVTRGKGLYADYLAKLVNELGLSDYILFLGVLDRNDQLCLMKKAQALIQPSLYEGWSTLVEEAKAMDQFIILSDLPVHREQINANVDFFDPHDPVELSDKMIGQLQFPAKIIYHDYSKTIKEYGKSIVKAFLN